VRIVVNGANKYTVVNHLNAVIKAENYNVKLQHLEEYGLVALQGPKSA
jgi:glycine cleavage system aminomethyltransferase T